MNPYNNHNKCVNDAFEKAKQICVEKELRFTNLRQKIYLIILQKHQPFKAYDILKILQKEDSSAKPATVYRALDFLLENKLIHKLHISNSYIPCHHPLEHKRCSFLICNKCNEVKQYCSKDLNNKIDEMGLKNNFQIEDTAVEIRGICNLCIA